jgi:hypothetical protein
MSLRAPLQHAEDAGVLGASLISGKTKMRQCRSFRLWIAGLLLGGPLLGLAAPFAIAVDGPAERADVTTHEIRSGNVTLGFSEFGGGYINKLAIPGIGDVLAHEAARYGRGGQVTIRDRLHGGKYNPTQAGFSATAGTHVTITSDGREATIARRPVSLWHGDGKYDFTEWENLAADPYRDDGGNSDKDGLDERNLPGKQATEITSEFDLYVQYSDAMRTGVAIPAFRFYYEFSYIRPPGHAMQQFRPGTPVYRAGAATDKIANRNPAGNSPSTPTTLAGIMLSSVLRGDVAVFDPKAIFVPDASGKLVEVRTAQGSGRTQARRAARGDDDDEEVLDAATLVIFSSGTNPASGVAIGFMQPNSTINREAIVGRKSSDHSLVYSDDRTTRSRMLGNARRTGKLWQLGARVDVKGLLSPNETAPGVYETLRGESFILVGTPEQILQASARLVR